MKKCLSILAFLLIANVVVFGQGPTLTESNYAPRPGDVFRSYYADTTGVQPGSVGPGQTWDYSTLHIDTARFVRNYIEPSATPYADSFPDATVCFTNPPSYSYMKSTSTEFLILGLASPFGAEVFTDPQISMTFPFAYPNAFTDEHYGSYSSAGMTFYHSGVTSTTADGWGILKLPSGNYSNMVRIKFVQDLVDSTVMPGTGNSASSYSVTTAHHVSYFWHDGINKNPALMIMFASNTQNGITVYGKFVTVSEAVSALPKNDRADLSLSIYPQPAKTSATVAFTLKERSIVGFSLINASGQIVRDLGHFSFCSGSNSQVLDLNGIGNGVYILKIKTDCAVISRKLIIE